LSNFTRKHYFFGQFTDKTRAMIPAFPFLELPLQGLLSTSAVTAFLLGLRHALEPGHGKAVIATYMGQPGSKNGDLLTLGGLITLTHGLVLAIGVAVVFVFLGDVSRIPEAWFHGLRIGSAALVVFLGWRMLQRQQQAPQAVTSCDHCHDQPNASVRLKPYRLKELSMLGLMSGLRPCPLTLSALFIAISAGRTDAFIFVCCFSLGMALVLIAFGLIGKLAGTSLISGGKHAPWVHRVQRILPVVSATAILGMGLFFLVSSLLDVRG
jgi:nickel/cobalt transporter (NicO) family protein